jgi:LexA-binding, inner membrane-associated putative hydrolase
MLPSGHIAAGALLGAWRSRGNARHQAWVIAGGMLATTAPDIDLALPPLLDRLGIEHDLNSGVHHRWVTHTPLFWGLIVSGAIRLSRWHRAPEWASGAADVFAVGVGLHLLQDSLANTVALLWPLRRREYGLGLDRLAGVSDHGEYIRRYPSSPAGKLDAALVLAALITCGWRLAQRGDEPV